MSVASGWAVIDLDSPNHTSHMLYECSVYLDVKLIQVVQDFQERKEKSFTVHLLVCS
jgi:hypothetical protein